MKNVAIIMGGYSSEYKISLTSGNVVFNNINRTKFNPYRIHIFKEKWVYVDENDADFPPFSILEQDPKAGSSVKDGRKVYVKLNAGEFTDITIPEFKDKTFRQISATVKALTLKEGKLTYKPHIAKDVVLQIYQNGRRLRAGDKVKKNSVLDFVLGDGKEIFNEDTFSSEEPSDTLPPSEEVKPIEFKEDNGGI